MDNSTAVVNKMCGTPSQDLLPVAKVIIQKEIHLSVEHLPEIANTVRSGLVAQGSLSQHHPVDADRWICL